MTITIEASIPSNIDIVWNTWITPEHIKKWNTASDDWHTTVSEIDFKEGGEFFSRIEAKDGSSGFDFKGVIKKIISNKLIEYTLEDGRNVSVKFEPLENGTKVIETFDAENENSIEIQRNSWQSTLNNFSKYVEAL